MKNLIKYESVEQRNDDLDVMTKYKYKNRMYGNDKSVDALDHSISLEPVEDFFSYNHNNEFVERDVMEDGMNQSVRGALVSLSERLPWNNLSNCSFMLSIFIKYLAAHSCDNAKSGHCNFATATCFACIDCIIWRMICYT